MSGSEIHVQEADVRPDAICSLVTAAVHTLPSHDAGARVACTRGDRAPLESCRPVRRARIGPPSSGSVKPSSVAARRASTPARHRASVTFFGSCLGGEHVDPLNSSARSASVSQAKGARERRSPRAEWTAGRSAESFAAARSTPEQAIHASTYFSTSGAAPSRPAASHCVGIEACRRGTRAPSGSRGLRARGCTEAFEARHARCGPVVFTAAAGDRRTHPADREGSRDAEDQVVPGLPRRGGGSLRPRGTPQRSRDARRSSGRSSTPMQCIGRCSPPPRPPVRSGSRSTRSAAGTGQGKIQVERDGANRRVVPAPRSSACEVGDGSSASPLATASAASSGRSRSTACSRGSRSTSRSRRASSRSSRASRPRSSVSSRA